MSLPPAARPPGRPLYEKARQEVDAVDRAQRAMHSPESVANYVSSATKPLNHYQNKEKVWKDDNGYWRQPKSGGNCGRFAERPSTRGLKKK